jgi:hypothetical protein
MFGGLKGIGSAFIALVVDVLLSQGGLYVITLIPPLAVWAIGLPMIGGVAYAVLNYVMIWLVVAVIVAVATS